MKLITVNAVKPITTLSSPCIKDRLDSMERDGVILGTDPSSRPPACP